MIFSISTIVLMCYKYFPWDFSAYIMFHLCLHKFPCKFPMYILPIFSAAGDLVGGPWGLQGPDEPQEEPQGSQQRLQTRPRCRGDVARRWFWTWISPVAIAVVSGLTIFTFWRRLGWWFITFLGRRTWQEPTLRFGGIKSGYAPSSEPKKGPPPWGYIPGIGMGWPKPRSAIYWHVITQGSQLTPSQYNPLVYNPNIDML